MKNNNKFHKILVVDVYTIMIHMYIYILFYSLKQSHVGVSNHMIFGPYICDTGDVRLSGIGEKEHLKDLQSMLRYLGVWRCPSPGNHGNINRLWQWTKSFPSCQLMSIVCMCFPKNVGEVNWSHPFDNILKGYDYLMAQQRQMICKTLTRKPGLNLGWCIMLLSLEIGVSRTWRISQPLDFTDSKQVNWCDWGFLEHKTEVFWTRHVRNSPAMTSVSRWQLNPCFSTSPGNGNKCPHFSWSKP